MPSSNMKQRIPNRLRKFRKAVGFSQKEVAKRLGLESTSQISRWEKGICLPSLLNIFKLALLYRTMVDALFIDLRNSLKEEFLKENPKLCPKNTNLK